jgi:hypothetical protein
MQGFIRSVRVFDLFGGFKWIRVRPWIRSVGSLVEILESLMILVILMVLVILIFK